MIFIFTSTIETLNEDNNCVLVTAVTHNPPKGYETLKQVDAYRKTVVDAHRALGNKVNVYFTYKEQ